ncbi:hypothetical protein A2Z00_01835 [Candidatus Gottesmanbacteria bacterium RBG_13_45_10]|uniref:Uncharacterized protein n=1 Tax=Candidatus Gottesmanbacteria bacterium RBG_13_45_10 TaxID=1798370 RepID=A0A1F5ZGZ9_9BACT|nr:MAG: hypothetical protein A2Z00_01835 [Candidatus Gottesmanbacteria bacterium RBG_13_45_10]
MNERPGPPELPYGLGPLTPGTYDAVKQYGGYTPLDELTIPDLKDLLQTFAPGTSLCKYGIRDHGKAIRRAVRNRMRCLHDATVHAGHMMPPDEDDSALELEHIGNVVYGHRAK